MTYEPPVEGAPEEERPAATPPPTPPDLPDPEDFDDELWPEEETVDGPDAAYTSDDFAGLPPYLPPAPAARGGGVLSAIAVVVLALGLVAATLWAVKLHRDKAEASGAAGDLLTVISEAAPAEMVSELTGIQGDLTAGKVQSARDRIRTLKALLSERKSSAGPQGAGQGPLPESAYKDLPPDAARFFKENEDLFRRFLFLCDRAREKRDQGENVDALRKVRDEAIEAARLGQTEALKGKLLEFARMLGGGARQAGNRGPLQAKAQELRQVVDRARKERRDLRAVFPLMQKAEQAAQGGDMTAAGKYLDQALAAARRAPRMAGRDARAMRFGPRGRVPVQNPLAPVVRALLGIMAVEEGDLRGISDGLLSARSILFGDQPPAEQPDALKPIIDKAMSQMKGMADRRRELQKQMQGAKRPDGKPLLATRPGGRGQLGQGPMTPEERRGMLGLVRERLSLVLDRVRAMGDDEYARGKQAVIRDIMKAVFDPPTPEEQTKLGQAAKPEPATARAREEAIRAKMLKASPVLRQWEAEGKDCDKIEELFAQARKDLYAGKLDEAEKAVDEALVLLDLAPAPKVENTPAEGEGTLKLNLRARPTQ